MYSGPECENPIKDMVVVVDSGFSCLYLNMPSPQAKDSSLGGGVCVGNKVVRRSRQGNSGLLLVDVKT